jgi:nicotinamide phosphoribosyltransferase
MTVATRSRAVKAMLKGYLDKSADSADGLPFMLHDFGYRGVSSDESAAIGGAAHIVNFLGTDTLLGMKFALDEYNADLSTLAFSVPATEHSVMTARGRQGEYDIVEKLIADTPTGILSVVADSFNIYDFVDTLGTVFHERVMARDGKFVVRPDSTTDQHPNPDELVDDLLERLWHHFGGITNQKGYRVLDPHVGLLWGDGLEPAQIEQVVDTAVDNGFSAENLVFGMGGGLLQKVNRDTQRFAFKASAIRYGDQWHDAQKAPLGGKKPSKPGRLKLIKADPHGFATVRENNITTQAMPDLLQTVFENGELVNTTTFEEVRARAAL